MTISQLSIIEIISDICEDIKFIFFQITETITTKYPQCFKDSFVVSTFIDRQAKESKAKEFKDFEEIYSIHSSDFTITSLAESGYLSIVAWIAAVSTSSSSSSESIRLSMYGAHIKSISGELIIYENNYLSRKPVLGGIKDGIIYLISNYYQTIQTKVWSPQFNNDEIFICNWKLDTMKGYTPSLKLGFILDTSTVENNNATLAIKKVSELLINLLNQRGGLMGYQFLPYYFIPNKTLSINSIISEAVNDDQIVALFGCLTKECLSEVIKYRTLNKLLYYFGPIVENVCHQDVISLPITPFQYSQIAVSFASTLMLDNYVIIYSNIEKYLFLEIIT